ncbi:MAG: 50S ribosomal protein L6 [Patescibacteria group bacterium]
MPRIGKQPVAIPDGVDVQIDGSKVTVKGPKGTLTQTFHRRVEFEQQGKEVLVTVKKSDEKRSRELWGLSRVLLNNMVKGVVKGFEKKLEVNGVGYRALVSGKTLELIVGFSHPVKYEVPEGITAGVEKNIITIAGIDKQLVGQVAAQIRDVRRPEPYKGKGIKYIEEVIRRKAGKVVKSAGAG